MSEKYLKKSAFAAQQGWNPSYVTKLKNQGRLVFCMGNPKLIDVDATLAELQRTGDPGKAALRQHHSAARVEKHVTTFIKSDAPSDDEPQAAADPKYWDNKTRREGTLADLAALELAKKSGELVEFKRVEEAAFAAGRLLRDTVLGLPTRLAPELAAMNDTFQIEIRMRDELRQIFSDVAKMAVDDLKRLIEQTPPTRMVETEGDERNALRR